jgi:diguanylate cyclase
MTLMMLVASGLSTVTLMGTFLAYDSVRAHSQLQNHLSSLANIVGQNSSAALDFDDQKAAEEVLLALRSEVTIVSACLYRPSGELFAQYQRQPVFHECGKQIASNSTRQGYIQVIRPVEYRNDFAGTLRVESDLSEIKSRQKRLLQVTAALLVISLVVGGIAGYLLQRRISRPIRDLSEAMREVTAQHNFAVRVTPHDASEIGQLGLGFNSMLTELEKRAEEKREFEALLKHQATNDELTGLPNRRLLADRLSHALAVAERYGEKVALLYIDLDGFKLVNDSLGHSVGDELLVNVAARLNARVRKSDTLARLGGDEFAVVLAGPDLENQAGKIAAAVLQSLEPAFNIGEHEITIGASIGVSFYPDHGDNAALLLQNADSAMYRAKREGKNRIRYFSEDIGASVRERLGLENQLRAALAHGGIHIEYQPEFEIGTRRIVRFEALARWTHPTLGRIPPVKFIPIAEESGLIVPLGSYIMERACREAVHWQSLSPTPIQVAVNVSSIEFLRDSFVDDVENILRRTGLKPGLLQIELTESVMVSGIERVVESMYRLTKLGVYLAIDDFGTGYSCLGYLPRLPFHCLKIDRSFVSEISSRPELEAMVHSLITLAHDLNMCVIVEGVETEQQLSLLARLGGNVIQGYLLGRPTADPSAVLQEHFAPALCAETK